NIGEDLTITFDLIGRAKRDLNPLRDYLIVNKTQSKHYPSDPRETASRCDEMGKELLKLCPSGKCLAVVFSETAVGIGALAASVLGERCFLISTTREELPDFCERVTLREAHSHAPLHKLRVREINLAELEHIFIIDDEFTTGNTVKALAEKILANCRIPISAHAFAASRESVSTLENIGVRACAKYIYDELPSLNFPEEFSPDEPERLKNPDKIIELNSLYDIRLSVNCQRYFDECEALCGAVFRELSPTISQAKSVEIIGTEEFCLPPILLGKMLAEKGFEMRVHGVTRSPILPADTENYPIKTRSVLPSLYDGERTVYLYNSAKCDITIIMTDAPKINEENLKRLCGACGGERVVLVSLRSREMRTSLKREDCELLLKDVTGLISPMSPA
ncbi:MAG: phosphoribosyltransferase family protein, partial [Oscillospiraceae bacterium]|nr:phosphoribosyltransferase family protein [Oscillospiraceae bacterium]